MEPGSRNEKKLCDKECLWWCPRLDADEERGAVISSGEGRCDGGRAPKVNPCPSGVMGPRVLEPGMLTLDPAEGINGTSSSMLISTSCDPSSEIVLVPREPGRGKKTDKLRECIRECRRTCFCGASGCCKVSGAECDGLMVGIFGEVGERFGNDEESGDGATGEKGVDVERVREWPLTEKEVRRGEAKGWPFRGLEVKDDR